MTESRNGEILLSIINGTPYTAEPQSRIEELLIELKEAIESGGGGGGNYNLLTNKPSIEGTTIQGRMSASDLNLASKDALDLANEKIVDNERNIKSAIDEVEGVVIDMSILKDSTLFGYKILNKQNISVVHGSESRANFNSYLILTQIGIIYIKVVEGVGTAVNLAGYSYDVTCTVSGTTVNIDLGYAWNVGVIIPVLNDYVNSVTFS